MGKGKNRWTDGEGWKGWTMAAPQPQESCYSRTSTMAQLPEQSWRCWREEVTCGVSGLLKLAPSLAAFSSHVSLLDCGHQQVGLALGVSVWAELCETVWRTVERAIFQEHSCSCRAWHRVSFPGSVWLIKRWSQMEGPQGTVGQCHQAGLKGILILQCQNLSAGPLASLKSFLPPGPQKVSLPFVL